jgi:hypothetical protein
MLGLIFHIPRMKDKGRIQIQWLQFPLTRLRQIPYLTIKIGYEL